MLIWVDLMEKFKQFISKNEKMLAKRRKTFLI